MDACLVVIGLDFRTAPLDVRERFWMSERQRAQAVAELVAADGVDEIILLSTCGRTEFILWSSDFSAAADSVLKFLTRTCGLRLCEWKHFYRLMCEDALRHLFRLSASLDSRAIGNPQITAEVSAALTEAQRIGAAGAVLDKIFGKALKLAERIRSQTALGEIAVSQPAAAVQMLNDKLGTLQGRPVLVLGAGTTGESTARAAATAGAKVTVSSRSYEHARQVADRAGVQAIPFEDRCPALVEADAAISGLGAGHMVLPAEEVERIVHQRDGRPLFLVDLSMPRTIATAVRHTPGVFLYDLDDLAPLLLPNGEKAASTIGHADTLIATELSTMREDLGSERVAPTLAALRDRLDQFRRQELERYCTETGPLSEHEQEALEALSQRIVQRIAGSVAQELNQSPQAPGQDKMSSAVQRIFHLFGPKTTLAGRRH